MIKLSRFLDLFGPLRTSLLVPKRVRKFHQPMVRVARPVDPLEVPETPKMRPRSALSTLTKDMRFHMVMQGEIRKRLDQGLPEIDPYEDPVDPEDETPVQKRYLDPIRKRLEKYKFRDDDFYH